MSRVNLFILSVVAVLSAGSMLVSSASAAVQFQWFVGGKLLAAGSSKVFKGSAVSTFDLNTHIGATEALMLSPKITVLQGKIFGGVPGTNEEVVRFESVKVDKPANCEIKGGGNIQTNVLKTEIVEGVSGGVGTGKAEILFTPKSGSVFTEFEYAGASCPISSNEELALEGQVLGSTVSTEAVVQTLGFEAGNEYKAKGGAATGAHLTFAHHTAKFTGTANEELESKEAFGAF